MRISDWSSDLCSSDLVEKFDIEDQRRVLLDRRISLLAVGQLTGNPEPVFGADGHHRHAFGPARDHLVQAELGGAAMLFGTVEHGTVEQGTAIVHAHPVA